ncbi:MAG: Ca-activated chloride channel family protein, partial [Pseudohongiellaceae bacterium]
MEVMIPSNLFEQFQFLRPLWLLALIPTLICFLAMWRINSVVTAWDKAIDKSLLPYLLDRSKNAAQRTPLFI